MSDAPTPSPADMPSAVDVAPDAETAPAVETVAEADTAPADAAQTETVPEQETGTDWKAEARKWESRAKANKAAQDQLAALNKVLNPDTESDAVPDVDALTAQLADRDKAVQQAKAETAIIRTAYKHGADPDALTDSRRFMEAVNELDPASDTFSDDLTNLIAETVKDHPHLAARPRTTRSGNETGGGNNHIELDPAKLADMAGERKSKPIIF